MLFSMLLSLRRRATYTPRRALQPAVFSRYLSSTSPVRYPCSVHLISHLAQNTTHLCHQLQRDFVCHRCDWSSIRLSSRLCYPVSSHCRSFFCGNASSLWSSWPATVSRRASIAFTVSQPFRFPTMCELSRQRLTSLVSVCLTGIAALTACRS